jgi:hypothetical protein
MRNKIKKAFLIVLPAFYTENSAFLIPFQGISHSILTIYVSVSAMPSPPSKKIEVASPLYVSILLRKRLGDAIFSILIFPFSFAS